MTEKQNGASGPRRPRNRKVADPPAAGEGGIEDAVKVRAAEAAQQAQAMKGTAESGDEAPAAASETAPELVKQDASRGAEEPAQDLVPTQGRSEVDGKPGADDPTAQNSGNHETQHSGQTPGNPENQNSGNREEPSGDTPTTRSDDYLGMVYGGVVDPYEDFRKTSTQLPPVVSRTLKAAAPLHGSSVQALMRDILLGRVKPLPESYPDLLERFYQMAQEGKLK